LRKQTSTLWVGNLPGYLEFKQDLQDLFSNFGPLVQVKLYNGVCNESNY
jgi:RNA recognition motif-containing protein